MSTEKYSEPQQSPQTSATATATLGETAPVRSPDETAGQHVVIEEVPRPKLLPPSVAGTAEKLAEVRAEGVTATWHTGVTITAMWSINEIRNAWIHVQNKGWRKIYNGRDGAFMALTGLAGQARQTKRSVTLREEADGMIYEIYLW
ncbi:hypothetical protein [Paractinoplanes rishiriensis]|uniref:Uncharacterized protein n=1 Tax=Paractinoplanes rishiriensis TaxID=1050105 RepID=A0A919MSF5_9ACTN|nr:hypothetical protein [Actinoplanes rishiriensis]GIE98136.1 hypothetical protein Ari01nite_56010 [Actinoplanes rishiriensis]